MTASINTDMPKEWVDQKVETQEKQWKFIMLESPLSPSNG